MGDCEWSEDLRSQLFVRRGPGLLALLFLSRLRSKKARHRRRFSGDGGDGGGDGGGGGGVNIKNLT